VVTHLDLSDSFIRPALCPRQGSGVVERANQAFGMPPLPTGFGFGFGFGLPSPPFFPVCLRPDGMDGSRSDAYNKTLTHFSSYLLLTHS